MRAAVFIWLAAAFVVWNGFFDVLVTRGEQAYLLAQARHELGLGPRRTIDDVMGETVRDAVRVAGLWAGVVLLAGAGSALCLRRDRPDQPRASRGT